MTWLATVLDPVGPEAFLAETWDRRMHHFQGKAGRFTSLIDWQGLSRLLEWTPLRPPRIGLVRGGKPVPESRYLRLKGDEARLDAGRFSVEVDAGATLVVNFLDELIPAVADLADELARGFGVRTSVNLYASWRAEHGLALHTDHHGVLVLQVSGRKLWSVHEPVRPFPLEGEDFVLPDPAATPLWSGTLEPGDVLYLPRGYPHVASAVDGPSLHLTVSLSEPTGIGFLEWLVAELRDSAELRARVPTADVDSWLATVRSRVGEAISDAALANFRSERDAGKVARPRLDLPAIERVLPGEWTASTRLRLASSRELQMQHGAAGPAAVRLAGRDWPCSHQVAERLAQLSSRHDVALGKLESELGDGSAELRRLLGLLFATGALSAR